MPKRSNEDLQSELGPAAKRFANQNENEIDIIAKQKLQAARTALARLDYKNTQQICTELIDSNYSDPSVPLILRSLALEKQKLFESSAEDAERALKLKESKKTHLRCSFAYLAHALYHLDRAQDQPEDEQEEDYSISEIEIDDFNHRIRDFKSLEAGNPFKKRVSEDLLLHMAAAFFDSPSLAIFSRTSKQMRFSIHESTELFKVFKMSGKGKNVAAGIHFFSRRCGNSIRSLDVKVKNKLDQKTQDFIQRAISLSSATLKEISICHQGDLCKLIIQVASLSPSLKILSSTSTLGKFSPLNGELRLPNSWNIKLTKLVWKGGGCESLICDDTLLRSLQSAKKVEVYSKKVRPSWLVNLLSSASTTLVDVSVPEIRNGSMTEIPTAIDLPNLSHLRLHRALPSKSTGDSLFKGLHAPNLRHLCLERFSIKDISHLPQGTSLRRFIGSDLLKSDGTLAAEAGEEEATSFVKAIKDWKGLAYLHLKMEKSTSPSFYTRLIDLLTPLSQQSIESGYGNSFLLPELKDLTLGGSGSSITVTSISARKLAIFVGTRFASWNGLSSSQISSIAAGDLSQVDEEPQGTPFAPGETYSRIRNLRINVPLKADDETLSWLEETVASLEIKHRVP